jgi:hypothetical protein
VLADPPEGLQQLYSVKVEHKFTDKVALTGFYLYNRTDEPCSNYLAGQTDPNRFIDSADYILKRRPQILALNNTWVLSDSSVLALRFGWTTFPDNPSLSIDFDPATLGFSQNFLGLVQQTGVPKFPIIDFTAGYDDYGHQNPVKRRVYSSYGFNGTYSRFVGTHTFKIGADYRQIGALLDSTSNPSGNFIFGREFTSSTGTNNGSAIDGNAMATFLLGFPSGELQSSGASLMGLTTPLDLYTNYFGGYVQDDWRVSPRFTLNYGVRIRTRRWDTRAQQQLHGRVRSHVDEPGQRHALKHHRSDRRHRGAAGLGRTEVRRGQRQRDPAGRSRGREILAARRCRLFAQLQDRNPRRLRDVLVAVELRRAEPVLVRRDRLLEQHRGAAVDSHADGVADQSVPERSRQAVGQQPRSAGGCGHEYQLRR